MNPQFLLQNIRKQADIEFIATTFYGLEDVLASELQNLGTKDVTVLNRAVSFKGSFETLYAANLVLRTAIRVLLPLSHFQCADENALYAQMRSIPWDRIFTPEHTFAIDPVLSDTRFRNSMFVAQRAKDGVADYFRDKYAKRPSVDRENPDVRINLHISGTQATLSLDSSGAPLFKRGYREQTGEAPINEVLAAAILYLVGWDMKRPLLDPMCGSGTICIEAALMAAHIPPGSLRSQFGFQGWKFHDRTLWDSLCQKYIIPADRNLLPSISGLDYNPQLIEIARKNAAKAGMRRGIHFASANFFESEPPADMPLVVCNPPYGERIGEKDMAAFYKNMGDTLKKKYAGSQVWIVSGNLDAVKHIGLRPSRKLTLFNGSIECRLLGYDLYTGSRTSPAAPV